MELSNSRCLMSFPNLSERVTKGGKRLFCEEWFNTPHLVSHKRVNQRLAWAKCVKSWVAWKRWMRVWCSVSLPLSGGRRGGNRKKLAMERFKTQRIFLDPTVGGGIPCHRTLGTKQFSGLRGNWTSQWKKILGTRKISGSRRLWPKSAAAGKTVWWGIITRLACSCALPLASTISCYQRQWAR